MSVHVTYVRFEALRAGRGVFIVLWRGWRLASFGAIRASIRLHNAH